MRDKDENEEEGVVLVEQGPIEIDADQTREPFRPAIDPEFQPLFPPLRPEEYGQLEESLVREGCRDPLAVWAGHNILLDGHHRYEICTRLGIPFGVLGIELPDREAALDWIDRNQLGRRNLTRDQYLLFLGRRYNRLKMDHGGDRRSSGNGCHLKTAEALAEQHGVSERTVRNAGEFADAIETLKKEVDPEIESKVVAGTAPPRGLITEAAKQVVNGEKEKAEATLRGERGAVARIKKATSDGRKRAKLEARAAAAREALAEAPGGVWEVVEGDAIEVLGSIEPGGARLIFAAPPLNDGNLPEVDYQRWLEDWIGASARVLTHDGSVWVLVTHEWAADVEMFMRTDGLTITDWVTWHEGDGQEYANRFTRSSRRLLHAVKDPNNYVFNADTVRLWGDVWSIPRLADDAAERLPGSPDQLPLALLTPIIECSSDPGDLVLDPFCGSATTGVVAIRWGRRFVGIERLSEFVRLSRMRLAAEGDLLMTETLA